MALAQQNRDADAHIGARPSAAFHWSRVGKNLVLIIALLLVNKFDTLGNIVCYLVLFAIALTGPAGALKALSIAGLLIVAGGDFVVRGEYFNYLKFSLLLVAGFALLRAARNPLKQPFLVFLLVFGFVAAALAVINGYFVEVSLLKVVSFTFGAFCLLSVGSVPTLKATELTEWTVSLILAAAVLSYLVLALGTSYGSVESISGRRFTGHLGMFIHPQTLGVISSLFSLYITGLLLFLRLPHRTFLVTVLAAWLVLLYLSESRTGVYGYILAIGITSLLVGFDRIPLLQASRARVHWSRLAGPAIVGLLALALLETSTGLLTDRTMEFIEKGKPTEGINLETLYTSREEQIRRAWENFQNNPATGISFGTDLSPHWQRKATLLSASTEKGFFPTAVLEEVGIVGAIPFVLFVYFLFRSFMRSHAYLAVATATGLFVANLGEMMLFSFGGMAMLAWTIVGMSLAGTNKQRQPRQLP